MKKTTFLSLAVAVAAAAMTGCSGSKKNDAAADSAQNSGTSLKVDSVGYQTSGEWFDNEMNENTRYSVDFSAQYPVEGPQLLVDSVRAYIAKSVNAPAGADLADGSKVMEAAGRRALSDAKETGFFGEMGGEESFSFKLIYETPRFVTFDATSYIYQGGAHGMGMSRGVTFDAATGATIGWDIFTPESKSKLEELVENAVCRQYFEVPDWKTYTESWDQEFALPTLPPAFTKDGVTLYYTPYEIGPYSAGAPTCTVPYSEMVPLMTPAAAALVK